MPVHVEELTSEVSVVEGELPLSPEQIEKLVRLVISRLAEHQRDEERRSEATRLRRQASPSFEPGE
jgi:hypothetical protein